MAPKQAGYNNSTLKQQNRGLVLKLIATGECDSRIDLAKRTGLSKMAATNIISEFLERGILEEREKRQVSGKGRNPILLGIAPGAPKMIGVRLSRDSWEVWLCDLMLKPITCVRFSPSRENRDQLMDQLMEALTQVLSSADEAGEALLGIGIASLGPVDVEQGTLLSPPNFYGIHDLPLVETIRERFDLPVFFDSLYNCAALTEKYFGNCKDVEDFIYLGIANGIGSGVVTGGRIWRGRYGMTSEIGHISVDWKGRICHCGNRGCVEAYASIPILERELREATGWELTFREFCLREEQRLTDGLPTRLSDNRRAQVDEIIARALQALAGSLTNVANTIPPQKIIIGHEGRNIPAMYLRELEGMINERKCSSREKPIRLERSAFEEDRQRISAGCVLLEQVFAGELFSYMRCGLCGSGESRDESAENALGGNDETWERP